MINIEDLPYDYLAITSEDELHEVIQQYTQYLALEDRPLEVMACRDNSKYDEEEIDQLLRIIMLHNAILDRPIRFIPEAAQREDGVIWVDKTDEKLVRKMHELSKKYNKWFETANAIKEGFVVYQERMCYRDDPRNSYKSILARIKFREEMIKKHGLPKKTYRKTR